MIEHLRALKAMLNQAKISIISILQTKYLSKSLILLNIFS
ncbi:hypothetical protein A1OE_682 [Candidatus Endolissoclinum faulkneri L2]|uniref:Uncharacterized protein n=1 Tax=Candidatus Endolissoclinum faulkneri L2 TaxID=1193729 RepID=K7YH38_9PROT|nr:hypothetical protein A1OE_682 [Candidatus Endolissoclinum faulkneri L2]